MFKIFKRRKDKPALTYGVMQYVSNVIERRQRKVAGYLNGKTKSFGKRKWTLFLFLFCVAMGGFATFILVSSISKKQDADSKEWKQSSIKIPSSVLQQGKQWDTLKMLEDFYEHRKDSGIKIHSLKKQVHH